MGFEVHVPGNLNHGIEVENRAESHVSVVRLVIRSH